jgi:hypothetical protein
MTASIALNGRRILYIAPRFFGYDDDIAAEMTRHGADVTRLRDRPFDKPFMTAVTKLAPGSIANAALPIYRKALDQADAPFDFVFVVNGQTLPVSFLDQVRRHSPNATFILYLWDSLRNRPSIIPALSKYDHIFGFDRTDAKQFGFRYRPLFFAPVFEAGSAEPPLYDISFIGTAHTDRAPIVHALDGLLPIEATRFWYLFLQAPWVRRYYGLKNGAFRRVPADIFHYVPMKKDEIGRVFQRSRAILDIEHPLQRGLTMRTLETLGARKKLITTNPRIVDEDFFDPRNILVIDRHDVRIDPDFFREEFVPPAPAVRQRYALAGWLDEILSPSG